MLFQWGKHFFLSHMTLTRQPGKYMIFLSKNITFQVSKSFEQNLFFIFSLFWLRMLHAPVATVRLLKLNNPGVGSLLYHLLTILTLSKVFNPLEPQFFINKIGMIPTSLYFKWKSPPSYISNRD